MEREGTSGPWHVPEVKGSKTVRAHKKEEDKLTMIEGENSLDARCKSKRTL